MCVCVCLSHLHPFLSILGITECEGNCSHLATDYCDVQYLCCEVCFYLVLGKRRKEKRRKKMDKLRLHHKVLAAVLPGMMHCLSQQEFRFSSVCTVMRGSSSVRNKENQIPARCLFLLQGVQNCIARQGHVADAASAYSAARAVAPAAWGGSTVGY